MALEPAARTRRLRALAPGAGGLLVVVGLVLGARQLKGRDANAAAGDPAAAADSAVVTSRDSCWPRRAATS